MRGCRDIAIELGLEVLKGFLPAVCCESCHEDADEGYQELISHGDDIRVCCAILRLMSEGSPS